MRPRLGGFSPPPTPYPRSHPVSPRIILPHYPTQATHEKTLHDVHFFGQFFAWLDGPFLERVHAAERGSPPGFLYGHNRVIGPVRLRQVHANR